MVRCRNHRRVPWKISRGLLFAWQTIVTVDSDFVADRGTRMSTIGVVQRLQTSVGLNVSECEFHVLLFGAAHGLGLQAYKRDLGTDLPLIILESDSSISKALVSRRGVGKQRHVQTRSLWILEMVAASSFAIKKIPKAYNICDVLTEANRKTLGIHLKTKGFIEVEPNKLHKQS